MVVVSGILVEPVVVVVVGIECLRLDVDGVVGVAEILACVGAKRRSVRAVRVVRIEVWFC